MTSGYGTQTRLFVTQVLKLGHPIAICAYYGIVGHMDLWPTEHGNVPVYPPHIDHHGQDIVGAHCVNWKADLMMSLMDIWVCEPQRFSDVRWACITPVDQEPLPIAVAQRARMAYQPIAMSEFGLKMFEEAEIDARYLPHGYDPRVYAPMSQRTAREVLGLPQDAFIVGMVAANVGNVQPRKAWYEQIEGFAAFKKRHSDAVLVLHTCLGMFGEYNGVNITRICEQNGLTLSYGFHDGTDVMVCDQYSYIAGFTDRHMNHTYNALDVLLHASRGEGFGLASLHAQAVGTPVITGDWTAMSELCWAGWKIPKEDAYKERTMLESHWYVVRPGAVTEALETAYNARGDQKLRRQAMLGAKPYQIDEVARRYLKPLLSELEERIEMSKRPNALMAGVGA